MKASSGGEGFRVPPVRHLVLWLTTACNLQCAYCYRGSQRAVTMPLNVMASALGLAASSGQPFHVQLAGGEPTLEPDLVAAAGRWIRQKKLPCTLALQTNGTLLDSHLAEVCRRYGITLGVSVDGPPAVQQRLRGGAAATYRALGLLAHHNIPLCVTTVLSSGNVDHLGELVLALSAFPNVRGLGLDPVVCKGEALTLKNPFPSHESLEAGIRNMAATLLKVNGLRTVPIAWREWDAVLGAMAGGRKERAYCHACRGESLAVCPEGKAYPCSQTVGDPAMEAGTVDGVDWERLKHLFRGLELKGDCGECPLDGRCPGDCPSRLHYNGPAGSSSLCRVYQAIMNHIQERTIHERTENLLFQCHGHGAAVSQRGCVPLP